MRNPRPYLALLLLVVLAAFPQAGHATARQEAVLGESFLKILKTASADSTFDVLVSFVESGVPARQIAKSATHRIDRYQSVSTLLHTQSAKNSGADLGSRVAVRQHFWIANMTRVTTDRDGLLAMTENPAIARIFPNVSVELIAPVTAGYGDGAADADATGTQSNLDAIGVHAAWAAGVTGKGRLIASIDTGVEGIHPALRANWRGLHGDTAAAWFDPLNGAFPSDNNGHGTHVMGVMVGHDGADTIGIAPDAEWITAAVIDRGRPLGTTIADIINALQWVSDPDGNPATTDDVPDVVCNSWGVTQQIINPCDDVFFEAIENVEALGIVCVFAAGNEGPNSMTMRNPADRATSPTSSFSVGAVDPTLPGFPVPSFSSRGPSACFGNQIKPELAAPGVGIRSSYKNQTYKVMNGTSMAAPHVAATVALLRQYNPDLTPEAIKQILLETADDIGDPGEDNASGKGVIDIPAALAAASPAPIPLITMVGESVDVNGNGIAAPGETVDLVVTLNAATAAAHNITGTLTSTTPGVTVLDPTVNFGTITVGASVANTIDPFTVLISSGFPVGDSIHFQLSLTGDPLLGAWTNDFGLVCGMPQGGMIGEIATSSAKLCLSNFGQIGMAAGSCLNAGGSGWQRLPSGGNLLHEASLLVSTQGGSLVDAGRATNGVNFDFAPVEPLTVFNSEQEIMTAATSWDDSRAYAPLGILVEQSAFAYPEPESRQFFAVEWNIRNQSAATISGVRAGLLVDIDFPQLGDRTDEMVIDPVLRGWYHISDYDGSVAGVIDLTGNIAALHQFDNGAEGKYIPTASEKLAAMNSGWDSSPAGMADRFVVLATSATDLAPNAETRMAVAFIVADSPEEFSGLAAEARRRYIGYTDVNDGGSGGSLLPTAYLAQNYPNPFNPETVISYTLPRDAHVRLDVYNILGQHLTTLVDDWNSAGAKSVSWNGTDRNRNSVPSGVYFYRLIVDGDAQTRKMVLVR